MSEIITVGKAEAFKRISGMLIAGVPHDQIAMVMNLTAGDLEIVIQNDQEFKSLHAIETSNRRMDAKTLDDGWNKLEEMSISSLLTNLDFMQDPDTLIKMATMANRANRRNPQLAPLRAQDVTSASFVITERYAERLEQMAMEVQGHVVGNNVIENNPDSETDLNGPHGPRLKAKAEAMASMNNGIRKETDYMPPAEATKIFEQRVEVSHQYTIQRSGHEEY